MNNAHNRVGLGTFPLANVFEEISKKNAKQLISTFLDQGGYYIDTAPLYGFGEVETLLGDVLHGCNRNKYFLITKCGYIDVEGKTFQTVQKSGKYDDVIRECDLSIKRLQTDYIDLYFLHSPDPNTPAQETMQAMVQLKKQGKIKHIGVSNVNLKELKEYNWQGNVEYIQNRFSLINRSIDTDFQEYLIKHHIGLIPYQVIDRGQLTSRVHDGINNLRTGDLRIGRPDWNPDKLQVIAEWSNTYLSPITKKLYISLEQLSIAWALHQPYLSFVIVGITKPNHIPTNLKANEIKLNTETLKEIDRAYLQLEKHIQTKYGVSIREFRGLNDKYY